MRFFYLLLILAVPGGGLCAQDWATLVSDLGPSVCRIELKTGNTVQSTGSGFLFSNQNKVLTNAHVVQEATLPGTPLKITLSFPFSKAPEKTYDATVDRISSDFDLAILTIGTTGLKPLPLPSSDNPTLMSQILVLGYPLGRAFKSTPGYIQALQDIPPLGKMLDLSAPVDFGNSGGPVLDAQGRVVGIVTAKFISTNFNLAVPLNTIQTFLHQKYLDGITVQSDPPGAQVFVDGAYRGSTPLTLSLPDREAEVVLEAQGFQPAKERIQPKNYGGRTYQVSLTPQEKASRKILIHTDPPGANLQIDNRSLGKTPVTIDVEPGSRLRFRLLLDGYKDFFKIVETDSLEDETTFKLERKNFFWD